MLNQKARPGADCDATETALLDRVRAFAPSLAQHAAANAANGRLDPGSLERMAEIGLFRAHVPAEFGGYELHYGVLTEVAMELGRYCGSTAWVVGVVSSGSWRVAKSSLATQQRIWADGPDVLIAGAFANLGVVCERADGGWIVSGEWLFCSGVHHADWVGLVIPTRDENGETIQQFGFVPRDAVKTLPTWDSLGMAATGSDNVVLDALFIPDEMMTPYADIDSRIAPGQATHNVAAYRLPLTAVFAYSVAAPVIGTAQAVLSAYLAAPPSRRGGDGSTQAVQLRISESAAEIDAARAVCRSDMNLVRAAAEAGMELGDEDKARLLRNSAYVAMTCRRATTRLIDSLGARGQAKHSSVQRLHADTCAGAAHGMLNWDVVGAPYAALALRNPTMLA